MLPPGFFALAVEAASLSVVVVSAAATVAPEVIPAPSVLRPVFEASNVGDTQGVIDGLNELMEQHPITPRISDHDPKHLHLHVATKAASVADLLIGESLLGLATLVCDLEPTRLGVCSASPCTNVYVDTSPNQSRRYCSERCSSRANVAAYRARQKAAVVS